MFFAKDEDMITILAVYVDDVFITGSWEEEIQSTQDHLLSEFSGKVELELKAYLKMEIERNGGELLIHQSEYCKSIVEMVYQGPTRRVCVPLDWGAGLTSRKEGEEKIDLSRYPYRQVMGKLKLMYLADMSRPDISNSVRGLGQQMHDPCMRHWKGLQHLLNYLASFPRMGIAFKREGRSQGP